MQKTVWLINLFGSPCSPSSFNPDNSLAALAGSLRRAGYDPLIIDFQTVSFCGSLVPIEYGKKSAEIIQLTKANKIGATEIQDIQNFNESVLQFQCQIIQQEAEKLIQKAQNESMPLFIGFKLYSGEGSLLSRRLAQCLRPHLKVPFLGGGPLIRVVGSKYIHLYSDFDFLLDGEADQSICDFAQFLEGKKARVEVPGLISREPGSGVVRSNCPQNIHDMATLTEPCYDEDVYPSLYVENEKTLCFQIDESRGCPNSCSFCVHPVINGNAFRVCPTEKIYSQMLSLQKRFGAYAFRFTGSNTPKKFLRELGALIHQDQSKLRFSCYASINTTQETIFEKLSTAGLSGLFFGVETTSQEILRDVFHKKGQPLDRVKALIGGSLACGIYTTTSWIYPMPGATQKVRTEMRDFIHELYAGCTHDHGSVVLVPSALVPNSEWFFNPKKFGFEVPDLDSYYKGYIELLFKLYLPRQMLGDWNFTMEGKRFQDLAAECDGLQLELEKQDIAFGITDDWMLLGKLSGRPMKEFRQQVISSFIYGDYGRIREIAAQINQNSKDQRWFESSKLVPRDKVAV